MQSLDIKLKRILAKSNDGGGDLSTATIRELRGHRATNLLHFRVVVALYFLLVCIAVGLVIAFSDRSEVVLPTVGGTGLLGAGSAAAVWRFAGEWSRANLLVILLEDASEADIHAVLLKLLG